VHLIDELRAEHVLIEKVAGSLRTFVALRLSGKAVPEDGERFLRFFRLYAGTYHHAREEDILMPALTAEAELAADSGPLRSLIDQHHTMAATLAEVAPLLTGVLENDSQKEAIVFLSNKYVRALWQHIDAENSVLLPESEVRLKWAGVHELPDRRLTEEEADARAGGEELAIEYPQIPDPEAIRGEGCVVCPSLGTTCGGLEREWWTDSEWETFADRSG
jgi:hemerythrin-like domain-containing protein